MTGKTHLAVGLAAALLCTVPSTPQGLVLCLGAGAVGSVISDIDVTTSASHRELVKISGIATVALAAAAFAELHWHLGILDLLQRQTNLWRILLGVLLFLGVCAFGMRQPHRTFMHSLLGFALLTGIVAEIFPFLAPAFGVGMGAHIALDLLNRKRVHLLWPLRGGVCFRLCPAEGRINNLICLAGTCAAALGLAGALLRCFMPG